MAVAVITGSAGLIGAEAARFFASKGLDIVGIDNDMRREFFGEDASTIWSRQRLEAELMGYRHCDIDIRDQSAHAVPSPPTPSAFSSTRWPTISAISCGRWRCRRPRSRGR
jgi:NAD(P)-dependent dehydrogenase (short-subunit alcohol dehydrogenase family)